jgi:hypothetical protein
MKTRYWLHTYSQRRHGRESAITANTVDRMSPAAFLKHLKDDHPDNENLLLFSVEITAAEFKSLDGHL